MKPEDCYDFALKLEEAVVEKQALKASITINSKMVHVAYQSSTPSIPKRKRKMGKKHPERPSSEFICPSPTSVFEDVGSGSGTEPSSPSYISDFNSNLQLSSPANQFMFESLRTRSNTYNGQPNLYGSCDNMPDVIEPEAILLHEVAYCVTVPDKPRLFLLTSRGKEGLICRVFLFANREKAHLLKLRLAQQFEVAYTEWQNRLLRRASRRRSSLVDRQSSVTSLSSEGSDALLSNYYDSVTSLNDQSPKRLTTVIEPNKCDCFEESGDGMEHSSSDEDDSFVDPELHREFKRRASCLANPERLLVGDEQLSNLQQRFNNALLRNDCSASSPSSDDDDGRSN